MKAKRVLIADDDQALSSALSTRCRGLGLQVETAGTGVDVITCFRANPHDLIILDVTMPAGGGMTDCEMLAGDCEHPPVPVVILTGRSDPETIRRCEALGAHYVLKGPDAWDNMQPILRTLLDLPADESFVPLPETGTESPPPDSDKEPTVLAVDDDPDVSRALRIRLGTYGVNVLRAYNGMQGYWTALKERPDAIIADYLMPEGRGNSLLGRLKSHPVTKDIPIIFLTGRKTAGRKDHALERELL